MLSVVKTEERLLERELRAAGRSIKEIEQQLSVSRSSVSLWVRDVELGPEERRRLIEKARYSQKKRTNKLPYGTAALRAHSSQIVQTIYGSIQKLGGFERADWLD